MAHSLRLIAALAGAASVTFAACSRSSPPAIPPASELPVEPTVREDDAHDAAPLALADAAADAPEPPDDPMLAHKSTRAALLALFADPKPLEAFDFDVGLGHINQGNRTVAQHAIARRACLEGLKGVVPQTPEQRAICGADNMVPIRARGDGGAPTSCIDVFEFPNKACELPFVWVSPAVAQKICKAQGKRLCDQEEWKVACRGDPEGGRDRMYAYGDELDLTICNTNKSRHDRAVKCGLSTMKQIWDTCTTDTEPSGSYPRCRSRFGVFDLHGNVAEIMTRKDWDGHTYSQLKGSAFHYVDVSKRPQEGLSYYERYPDHCNFDPRWHVERIEEAAHVNYHLGFRCCKSL